MQQLVITRGILKKFQESEQLELLKDTPEAARVYRSEILVRFGDCDPAGIVYYPRYMEMFNNLVEDWCREASAFLGLPGHHRPRRWGMPAVHLNVDFRGAKQAGRSTFGLKLSLLPPGQEFYPSRDSTSGPGRLQTESEASWCS